MADENEQPLSMSELVNQESQPAAEQAAPADPAATPADPGAAAEPVDQATEGAKTTEAAATPTATPTPDPVREYNERLQQENAQLRQREQAALDAQSDILKKTFAQVEKLLAKAQPGKTAEQIASEADAMWKEISADPHAFVEKRIATKLDGLNLEETVAKKAGELVQKQMEELAPVVRELKLKKIYAGMVEQGFEKVADPKFKELMQSAENVKSVLQKFYPSIDLKTEAAKLHDDPVFHERLMHAAEARAAAAPKPVTAQATQDKDTLRKEAAAQGAAAQPAGHTPGNKPVEDDIASRIAAHDVNSLGHLAKTAKWR